MRANNGLKQMQKSDIIHIIHYSAYRILNKKKQFKDFLLLAKEDFSTFS